MTRSLLIVAVLAARAHAQTELSMADLQALDKAQNWNELLDGADRVKPSARTADWQKLVTSAATHVVDQIDHDSETGLRAAEKLIAVIPAAEKKYGFLRSEKAYLAGKAKVLGRVVAICAKDGYGCGGFVDALADGVTKFPPGVARQIATLMSEDAMPSTTVHYWALAADDDKDSCQDGRMEAAVLGSLRGSGGRVADAQHAATVCYEALEVSLVTTLDKAQPKDAYIANACPVLKARGTKTIVKKKCP